MITFTEPYSPANAGIVWFPRLNPEQPLHAKLIHQGKKHLAQLLALKLDDNEPNLAQFTKRLLYVCRIRTAELCRRKQAPPMKTNEDPFNPIPTWTGDEAMTEEAKEQYTRRQTALDWNFEAEYAILNFTPLHRSKTNSRDDLILAWVAHSSP